MNVPPEKLTEEAKLFLAILAGCKLKTNYNPENGSYVLTTENPIGIQLINDRYVVREYVGDRKK